MVNKYSPGKKNIGWVALMIVIISLLLFYPAFNKKVVINTESVVVILLWVLWILYFYLGWFYTYVSVDEKELKIVKMLFLRKTISISSIQSLKHKYTFAGAFQGVEVNYLNRSGRKDVSVIPVSALGIRNVSAIIKQLIQQNPSIQIDQDTQKLMH